MKSIQFILFSLFASVQCVSYAQENTHIFVGQNDENGSAKTAFILELVGEDANDHVLMNDKGELYLKVDRIVAIPKDNLFNFMAFSGAQELPLEKLAKDGNAKLKDLGVSDKLIAQIDSKQQKLQQKLEKSKAKMQERARK